MTDTGATESEGQRRDGTNTSSGQPATGGEPRDCYFKLLIVGESGSGKTSILQRYVNGTFSSKFRTTIGVDFLLKNLSWDDRTSLRIQFWDIAGQERFGHMTPMYYREAAGALVVYDLTSQASFDFVPKWKQDLDSRLSVDGNVLPVVLMANKSDLFEETVDKERMDQFCKENGFIGWFLTSAKDDKNVKESVECLIAAVLAKEFPQQVPKKDVVDLGAGKQQQPTKTETPCQC